MLCQLVCLDRRYQRMNCFNVRELQILLRGRFFADLVNDTAHHDFLNNTMIGLRFKTNNLNVISPNMLLSYQYGLNTNSFVNQQTFNSNNSVYNFTSINSSKYNLTHFFNTTGYNNDANMINHSPTTFQTFFVAFINLFSSVKRTIVNISPF
jgi:hypothetical protein